MRKKFIAGNWKMNGDIHFSQQFVQHFLSGLSALNQIDVALFPPYIYLPLIQAALKDTAVGWGAQNVSEHTDGAYTGEISASMLKDWQCRYVIVGHSERRQFFLENNQIISNKCLAALHAQLIPILCVGETLLQREEAITEKVVQEQLEVVRVLKDNCDNFSQLIIAYEPVWAIGTGKSATPEQANAVHLTIREWLDQLDANFARSARLLYGGSVKAENAAALFEMPEIDGALVGGASLDAAQFLEIGSICNKSF